MKKCLLLVIGFFLLCKAEAQNTYHGSETKLFDLIHTTLELKPDWTRNQLEGSAELLLKPWFYAQDELILDAKGMTIHSVGIKDKKARFEYDQLKLKIHLDRKYTKGDTLQINVDYTAKPDLVKEVPAFKDQGFKGLYFINKSTSSPEQLWTEGETEYNSVWFPTLDSPNQKHTQTISLTVPTTYKTLSNGLLIKSKENKNGTRTDTWYQNIEHAVYLTMIAAGEFEKVVDERFKEYEVSYYVEPQFKESAQAIFGRTPAMIWYFEDLLDMKFPWQKYAQIAVRDYVSGAMENTTATVHGSGIQKTANQLIDGNNDGVIAHELFHHWFGNIVTAESWANLTLNEAFADYSEYLWQAHYYGAEEGQWQNSIARSQYLDEAEDKQLPVIRYAYEDKENMFDNHTYAKGGRILHMLRQEVGDEAFFASLQLYLKDNAFQNAEIHDLRQAFEEVTGRDLNGIFEQWFLKPGHPRLHIDKTFENGRLKLNISQKLDSVNQTIYQFPLTLELGQGDNSVLKTVYVNDSLQSVEFKLDDEPSFVNVDPFADFLGEVEMEHSEKELFAMATHSKGVVTRAEAFRKLTNTEELSGELSLNAMFDEDRRNMTLDLLEDPFWRIRELAVHQFFDYDGDDFLKVERQLQSIIRTDEKSNVRSAAILAMKNFLNPQNDLLFRKALADTSYGVRAASLEAILISTPPDADSLCHEMADINDVNIFTAVANHRAEKASADHYEWFTKRMSEFTGSELYQTMGILGSYLVAAPQEIQLKSIDFVKDIALNESLWVGRYAATQTIFLLTEHPEAMEALREIISSEKHPQLKELYKQLPVD
ncbi:M1 family metallopeptidase [Jiulongibacter sp. NS-SX5]|uniref:M1 family metallopeptidase n=1 Tax=Jiulongibacter sp. NS-SX5 TaxID=3463854 RepID=UPI004059B1A0